MTLQSKKENRENLLEELQLWHTNLGITNFPKRFGIPSNQKKFREITFRVKDGVEEANATVDDIVISKQPVYGLNHSIVGYIIRYRLWLPQEGERLKGEWSIRFSLHTSVIGLVKVGNFFIAVEHDNFPLQQKTVGTARMFGVTNSQDLDTLANLLLTKEYPFIMDNLKETKITQLGSEIYIDPTSRYEKCLNLLIELKLNIDATSKEALAEIIEHRNKEMLLHRIFTEDELKEIYLDRFSPSNTYTVIEDSKSLLFAEQYSLYILAAYFSNH